MRQINVLAVMGLVLMNTCSQVVLGHSTLENDRKYWEKLSTIDEENPDWCTERNYWLRVAARYVRTPSVMKRIVSWMQRAQENSNDFSKCRFVENEIDFGKFEIDGDLVFPVLYPEKMLGMDSRRALVDLETWTVTKQDTLVVRVIPNDGKLYATVTSDFLSQVATKVNQFFNENSNGLQRFEFSLHNDFVKLSNFVKRSDGACVTSEGYKLTSSHLSSWTETEPYKSLIAQYDRVVMTFPHCNSLGFAGLGQIQGKLVWMNGMENDVFAYSVVLSHELGHTNGAQHAEHEELEYGNQFSIMGSASMIPDGHFSVGAKMTFKWIDEATQIKTLGHCNGCSQEETVWVHSHDQGSYVQSRIYGLRFFTTEVDEYVFIEYRGKYFKDANRGPLVLWAYAPEGGTFGPTQLIDYIGTSSSQLDATIPIGESYVYDLGENNLLVSVLEISGDEMSVKIHARVISDADATALLQQAEANLETMQCDKVNKIDASHGSTMQYLHLDQPADLVFDTDCSEFNDDMSAGLYIYPRLPLNFFLDHPFSASSRTDNININAANLDVTQPGAGATYFHPINAVACDASRCTVNAKFGSFFTGEWAIQGTTFNGMPVYQKDKTYFLSYDPDRWIQDVSTQEWAQMNAWVISPTLQKSPSSIFAYIVPKDQTQPVSLGSLSNNAIQGSYYYDQSKGWTLDAGSSFECSKQVQQVEIADLFTSVKKTVTYETFSHDNYVLVHGVGRTVSVTPRCQMKYCAENYYFDGALNTCAKCPAGYVSDANSTGASSCYQTCENIVVETLNTGNDYLGAHGIFIFQGNVNGAVSFAKFSADLTEPQLYLYRVKDRWVFGNDNGSRLFLKTIAVQFPTHPMNLKAVADFKFTCACPSLNEIVPSCAKCQEGSITDPSKPSTCFKSCKKLQITVAQHSYLNGVYEFQKFVNDRPMFKSPNRELWATAAGFWIIGNDHESGAGFVFASNPSGLWPTSVTKWESMTDRSTVQVTTACAQEAATISETELWTTLNLLNHFQSNTKSPTTKSPTTGSPTTKSPTTKSPTTGSPTTRSPTTKSPTTSSPTTKSPTTGSPTTKSPTTGNPTTKSPTTPSPTTKSPTTGSPTTKSPTPTTKSRTPTNQPTTNSPTATPRVTKHDCKCLQSWSYQGYSTTEGECTSSGDGNSWCYIDQDSCIYTGDWDYCKTDETLGESAKDADSTNTTSTLTQNGCHCLMKWDYQGYSTKSGECADSGDGKSWCMIDSDSCTHTETWDYCQKEVRTTQDTSSKSSGKVIGWLFGFGALSSSAFALYIANKKRKLRSETTEAIGLPLDLEPGSSSSGGRIKYSTNPLSGYRDAAPSTVDEDAIEYTINPMVSNAMART